MEDIEQFWEDNPEPDLPDYLWSVWDVFWTLHGDRQQTMGGPGRIPFTSIVRYAEAYGVRDLDYLVTVIGEMDRVYMEHAQSRVEKVRNAGRGRGRRG